jgi:hypothetical protein
MKTLNKLALVCAALAATLSFGQTAPNPTAYSPPAPSIGDNPGALGHSYFDFNYTWVDFDENNASPRGYVAGLSANMPLHRGLDVGLGYNYLRENNHRNPFNNSPFDVRAHQVTTNATLWGTNVGVKPFVTGAVGYKWSQGDLQSFRTYDDTFVWAASAGAEIPLGTFALTPRVAYSDDFHSGHRDGIWHYGAQAHHWFSEKLGGYLDVAWHNPRERLAPENWTYTAGLRMRF